MESQRGPSWAARSRSARSSSSSLQPAAPTSPVPRRSWLIVLEAETYKGIHQHIYIYGYIYNDICIVYICIYIYGVFEAYSLVGLVADTLKIANFASAMAADSCKNKDENVFVRAGASARRLAVAFKRAFPSAAEARNQSVWPNETEVNQLV